MNISSVYRLALPLGLLMLVLCSTGFARECYACNDWKEECSEIQTCTGGEDGCMKLTELSQKMSRYGCRSSATCSSKILKEEFGLSSVNLKCCTYNLCNKGLAELPGAGLILSLAAVLLLLFI
ncbi:CD59 glycoprotein-like [Gastrophryne carolinensis]